MGDVQKPSNTEPCRVIVTWHVARDELVSHCFAVYAGMRIFLLYGCVSS
jgi:hypothetical protein